MKYFFVALVIMLAAVNVRAENKIQLLDIKFPDAETGEIFQLSQQKPQLTLLSFWQVDCEPCLKDLTHISTFSQQHKDIRVLAISISDKNITRQIWQQQKMPFPSLVNNEFPGALLKRFGNSVGAVPYTAMLSPDRHLCWTMMGQITEEQLQQGIVACRIRA